MNSLSWRIRSSTQMSDLDDPGPRGGSQVHEVEPASVYGLVLGGGWGVGAGEGLGRRRCGRWSGWPSGALRRRTATARKPQAVARLRRLASRCSCPSTQSCTRTSTPWCPPTPLPAVGFHPRRGRFGREAAEGATAGGGRRRSGQARAVRRGLGAVAAERVQSGSRRLQPVVAGLPIRVRVSAIELSRQSAGVLAHGLRHLKPRGEKGRLVRDRFAKRDHLPTHFGGARVCSPPPPSYSTAPRSPGRPA